MSKAELLVVLTRRLAIRMCVLTIRPDDIAAEALVRPSSSTKNLPTRIAALVMI